MKLTSLIAPAGVLVGGYAAFAAFPESTTVNKVRFAGPFALAAGLGILGCGKAGMWRAARSAPVANAAAGAVATTSLPAARVQVGREVASIGGALTAAAIGATMTTGPAFPDLVEGS